MRFAIRSRAHRREGSGTARPLYHQAFAAVELPGVRKAFLPFYRSIGQNMPPRIIDSKQSQLEILQQLFDNLNKLFARFEHIGHYDCLRDYKGSEDFAEFGLDFWKRTDWVGISLWGPPIDGSTNPKN